MSNKAISSGGLALLMAVAAVPSLAVGASVVEEMIVGRNHTLMGVRALDVTAAAVQVSGRRCTVAAATPLAALIDAQDIGGPAVRLRDYGHCDSRPINSAQLFVTAVSSEANNGQDGWEYKVGHAAGTTGAADTGGAFGEGKLLHYGQRVLWFWCISRAGGCQRTLETTMSNYAPAANSSVSITVTGYDNYGRGIPIRGALVKFGGVSARSGSDGRASMRAPAHPGRYTLSASAAGLVPAFPRTITVR